MPLVPGEKLPSTLIIMQYCGFSSACQAFYRTLASLCYESWLAQTIVSGFLTCFVLLDPAGRCFLVQWKGGSVDVEQVRKRGLKVILICLWQCCGIASRGITALWCISAFWSGTALKAVCWNTLKIYFQTALSNTGASRVALQFTFWSHCFLSKLSRSQSANGFLPPLYLVLLRWY